MARIFHEINYSVSVTDSVDDLGKFTSHSSAEAPAPPGDYGQKYSGAVSRVEVETQTTRDDEQVYIENLSKSLYFIFQQFQFLCQCIKHDVYVFQVAYGIAFNLSFLTNGFVH